MFIPDVSVIIPVYNAETYISTCLDSVVNQTLCDIEVICAYDFSTDTTEEIIQNFCQKYPFVKLNKSERAEGLASARNRGICQATGRYLYFLDADDAIVPYALEALVKIADSYNADVVLFDSEVQDSDGLGAFDYKWHAPELEGKVLTGEEMFVHLFHKKQWGNSVWRRLWRKDFLSKNGLSFMQELRFCEDFEFSCRAMFYAERTICTNKTFHIYNSHFNSLHTTFSPEKAKSAFRAYYSFLRFLSSRRFSIEASICLDELASNFLSYFRRQCLKNSQKLFPSDFTDVFERQLFKAIMQEEDRAFIDKIEEHDLVLLQKMGAYIYGAGNCATELVKYLRDNFIEIKSIVVTKKNPDMAGIDNLPLIEVDELKEYASPVIIGVVKKTVPEIMKTLTDRGFRNIIVPIFK
ncbi:MAG: glycosyltransferase [Treponema sp.]|nr:glycosyltransferase [Treponema sp.]